APAPRRPRPALAAHPPAPLPRGPPAHSPQQGPAARRRRVPLPPRPPADLHLGRAPARPDPRHLLLLRHLLRARQAPPRLPLPLHPHRPLDPRPRRLRAPRPAARHPARRSVLPPRPPDPRLLGRRSS
ncbi:hypothetical protein BN1708_019487, partial [Verticillium longisporum]